MAKRLLYILIFTIGSVSVSLAQPGDPDGDPDQPVPITGIEILIAAGGLFGAKKIIDSRRKKQ